VAGAEETDDQRRRLRPAAGRRPGDEPDAVEAVEADLGSNPQIAARGLLDHPRAAVVMAINRPEREVTELGQPSVGIDRPGRSGKEYDDEEDERRSRPHGGPQNSSNPRRRAMITAWVRSLAPSLPTRFLM